MTDDEQDPLLALRRACLEQLADDDTIEALQRIAAATEPLSAQQQESIVQRLLRETSKANPAPARLAPARVQPPAGGARRARTVTAWSVAAACVLCWAVLRLPQHQSSATGRSAASPGASRLSVVDSPRAVRGASSAYTAMQPSDASHVEAARLTELAASCAREGKLAEADALYFRAFEMDPPPAVF